jgi:hypothetical protein
VVCALAQSQQKITLTVSANVLVKHHGEDAAPLAVERFLEDCRGVHIAAMPTGRDLGELLLNRAWEPPGGPQAPV